MDLNKSLSFKQLALEKKFDFFKKANTSSPVQYWTIGYSSVLLLLMILFDKLGLAYSQVLSVVSIVSLLSGFAFLMKSVLLFKAWNESKGHTPLMPAIVLMILAFLLCYVEAFISSSHVIIYAGNVNLEGY